MTLRDAHRVDRDADPDRAVKVPLDGERDVVADVLLERRNGAERALASVVATCYLLGYPPSGRTSSSRGRAAGAIKGST